MIAVEPQTIMSRTTDVKRNEIKSLLSMAEIRSIGNCKAQPILTKQSAKFSTHCIAKIPAGRQGSEGTMTLTGCFEHVNGVPCEKCALIEVCYDTHKGGQECQQDH